MKYAVNKLINYFAYGSNLKADRLLTRNVIPEKFELAFLNDHELVFNKKSIDDTGKANIQKAINKKVWGIIYSITNSEFHRLHRKYEKGYAIIDLNVNSKSKKVSVKTFIAQPNMINNKLSPSEEYLEVIIEGAHEKKLPKDYIIFLQNFQTI